MDQWSVVVEIAGLSFYKDFDSEGEAEKFKKDRESEIEIDCVSILTPAELQEQAAYKKGIPVNLGKGPIKPVTSKNGFQDDCPF